MYQWGALWETCSTKKGGALSPFSSSLSDENSPAREINKPFAEWETSSKLIYRDQRSFLEKTPNSENPSFFSGFLTLGHANSSALRSATRHHAVGWIGSQADQSTSGSLRGEIFQISWWILICKISEIHVLFLHFVLDFESMIFSRMISRSSCYHLDRKKDATTTTPTTPPTTHHTALQSLIFHQPQNVVSLLFMAI